MEKIIVPGTDYGSYSHTKVCEMSLTNDNVFNNFKRIPQFERVLEHTTEYNGHQYASAIINRFNRYFKQLNWDKLKENDKYGNARIIDFPELELINNHYSPSTIHYIFTSLFFIDNILSKMNNINLLEIGGGYGGLCKVLLDICQMLNVKIENYGLIDLQEASRLQNKYLSNFNFKNIQHYEYENQLDYDVFKKYNVMLSIYAFGEFPFNVQDYYVKNIISHFENYYIEWNTERTHPHFQDTTILPEDPPTWPLNKSILKIKKK
jgi:hypothetical protein